MGCMGLQDTGVEFFAGKAQELKSKMQAAMEVSIAAKLSPIDSSTRRDAGEGAGFEHEGCVKGIVYLLRSEIVLHERLVLDLLPHPGHEAASVEILAKAKLRGDVLP